jgi:hypothetical protein
MMGSRRIQRRLEHKLSTEYFSMRACGRDKGYVILLQRDKKRGLKRRANLANTISGAGHS